MAAAIEQHHDKDGIVWPLALAPFEVVIILMGAKDEAQQSAAEALYADLQAAGMDVLLDDRDERPGVKFKDWDLIGVPIQVVVGKSLTEGNMEISLRRDKGGKQAVPIGEAAAKVSELTQTLKAELA